MHSGFRIANFEIGEGETAYPEPPRNGKTSNRKENLTHHYVGARREGLRVWAVYGAAVPWPRTQQFPYGGTAEGFMVLGGLQSRRALGKIGILPYGHGGRITVSDDRYQLL